MTFFIVQFIFGGFFCTKHAFIWPEFDPQTLHVLFNDSPRSSKPSLSSPSWREVPSNLQSTLELSTLQVHYSLWRLSRLLHAQHVAVFSSSNNGIAFAEFSVFAISMLKSYQLLFFVNIFASFHTA